MATQTPVSNPYLTVNQITDQYIRKNFENLQKYFSDQNQFLDFKFFELVFTSAQTGVKQAHGLPYIPLDVLVTRITGSGLVTFKYGSFDSTNIVMDVSGACRIRFFAGSYQKQSAKTDTVSSDTQVIQSGSFYASVVKDIDCTAGAQIFTLPLASTVPGQQISISKRDSTTNRVTVLSASGNSIGGFRNPSAVVVSSSAPGVGGATSFTLNTINDCVTLMSNGATTWYPVFVSKSPTRTVLTSGTSTYTTPGLANRLNVRMVGGGGGGGGTGSGGTGGTGGTTTFGISLLTCVGGFGGTGGNAGSGASGGIGGAATIGTGASGLALRGSQGTSGSIISGTTGASGGGGGSSPFGGAGGGGSILGSSGPGFAAVDNTGSGGGGGGQAAAATSTGAGGGAGGYIEALISVLAASYAYSIGTAGTTGAGGTNSGAPGGSGVIIVDEYYQ